MKNCTELQYYKLCSSTKHDINKFNIFILIQRVHCTRTWIYFDLSLTIFLILVYEVTILKNRFRETYFYQSAVVIVVFIIIMYTGWTHYRPRDHLWPLYIFTYGAPTFSWPIRIEKIEILLEEGKTCNNKCKFCTRSIKTRGFIAKWP